MKIADQMGEHEERLLLVLDGERSRRGVVFQYRYRGGDCRDEVVFVRSQVVSVKSVTLEGHVVKMVGAVAPSFFTPRSVAALQKISPDVVLHPRLLHWVWWQRVVRRGLFEGCAWDPKFGISRHVGELAVVVPDDALDAVRPGSGDAQRNRHALIRRIFVTQDLRYLSLRIVVQQLVCD